MNAAEPVHSHDGYTLDEVTKDIHNHASYMMEFPITSMSQQLARVIEGLDPPLDQPNAGLDVGTGCGIHSFVMYRRGFRPVLAIDCNDRAVTLAYSRGLRLGINSVLTNREQVVRALLQNGNARSQVLFYSTPLQELMASVESKFHLIVFNPPSFFYVRQENLDSPAATGVYASHSRSALDVKQGLLYQFFASVVLPLLAPGGQMVCTWPGLERRTVELDPTDKRSVPSHPANLLESWFDVTIECDDRQADSFYNHTAIIGLDYGLGSSFWSNFSHTLQDPRCYSALVKPSDWKNGNRPSFRYGVLQLRRCLHEATHFESVAL